MGKRRSCIYLLPKNDKFVMIEKCEEGGSSMSDNEKLMIEAILVSVGLEPIRIPNTKINCKQQ